MTRATPISLWDKTSLEPDFDGSTPVEGRADVVIIGGGYTGLSAALRCAARGLEAHVLEAERIGHGGSGRNVGLVNAGAWLPPDAVRATLGATYGPRFLRAFGDGPSRVFDLIERHQIRCDAVRHGAIHAAHAASGFRDLQARHAQWRALGAPVELLGRDAVSEMSGARGFHGGLLDRRAGVINPMAYCRGLARAARAAGARISTGARADAVRREGDAWRVETTSGAVSTRSVVLATNAYADGLHAALPRGFTTIRYAQIATEPLGARGDAILAGGQGLWDTAPIMSSVRRDTDGRLLIGVMGRVLGDARRGATRRFAARLIARRFPELGDVETTDAWEGRIAMTPEHLPRLHRLDDGVWAATGYSGRGITTGTLLGAALADRLAGDAPDDAPIPLSEPAPARRSGVMSRLYDAAFTANQLFRGL